MEAASGCARKDRTVFGREHILLWEDGQGALKNLAETALCGGAGRLDRFREE
jgi:hypothetical protein